MKKRNMIPLMLSLAMIPAAGTAQELPDFLSAVYAGIGEGLEQGTLQALAAMDRELTLELAPQSRRIEEGHTMLLTVKAGNPRPQAAPVTLTLSLPGRLTASPDCTWEAVLPEAKMDPQTGEIVPSETTFTREIVLAPGGVSESVDIHAEMSMGTRFYRTQTALELCVPDVSADISLEGTQRGRVQPGDSYAYVLDVKNDGTAPKDVRVELTLPEGVDAGMLPAGFAQAKNVISGQVRAEAMAQLQLSFPVTATQDVLEGDGDALRLLSGALHIDGERVPLPRVEVCGPKISARLLPGSESMEAGEETTLSVVVVNAGLAAADVQVSCVLPEGLMLPGDQEATPGEAAVLPPKEGAAPRVEVPGVPAAAVSFAEKSRMLVFDLHMDAARETADGIIANTQVLEIPVTARVPQDDLSEYLMGATLAWSVDEQQAQLGEAVVMRVHQGWFMGISKDEWNGVFWAGVLLMMAAVCLCAAARRNGTQEDFCCE